MKAPTIHLNGSSAERLIEQWRGAYRAIREAQKALEAVDINGRDYYPQGIDAHDEAVQDRFRLLEELEKVRVEVRDVWFDLCAQQRARDARRGADIEEEPIDDE